MLSDQSGPNGRGQLLRAPAGEPVVVALLGEIALRRDGALTALPGARSRLLLAALALRPGRSRSAQSLIDDVWGEQPPRAPMNALHTQVSRLRSALPDGALEIGPAGYRLTLPADQVDLTRVAELGQRARACRTAGDDQGCLELVAQARALWRGEPGADLPPGEVAEALNAAATSRLAELDTLELAARESTGDLDGALRIARLRAEVNPVDESAQLAVMRLLAAAGRANEALESFAAFRIRLVEHLGADPGPALVDLNTAILRGEPLSPNGSAVRSGSKGLPQTPSPTTLFGDGSPAPPDTTTEFGVPAAIGLRAAPNALLGRADDLAALDTLLRTSRVTTVLGPGGSGKTRIANEVGARVAGSRRVVLVELASLRADAADAPVEIEAAISAVLGLSDLTYGTTSLINRIDARKRLHEAVSARPMLLILDNCEHVIDAVAVVVADLIGAADRLTVLTTSRAPLMITAETVYPLPSLTIDPAGSPATELFAARARAIRPGVRLDPDVVAQLCHTLDGLPLAIELAAARVRAMSVEEINLGLADRFSLLRHGDRSSPERHRTLHAVIDWSWNLLDAAQQAALRRLCRFPAGFTLSAAEMVAGGPEISDIATAVDGLVNQSLLTVLDEDALGTRYRMLETVREYGEEQLAAQPGEADLVNARMMAWARAFAVDVVARYATGDQVRLALSVATELDNLLATLRTAIDNQDADTAYTVFPVVAGLWMLRGSHMEVIAWARRIAPLEPDESSPSAPSADLVLMSYQTMFLHFVHVSGGVRELARMRTRVRRMQRGRTDLSPSVRFVSDLVLCRPDGRGLARLIARAVRSRDAETRGSALLLRANIKENLGDVRGSTVDAVRAQDIFGPENVWNAAMVSRHLGQVYGQIAEYAEAVVHYHRSLDMLQRLGAYEDTVETRSMLVAALLGAGEPAAAEHELDLAFSSSEVENTVPAKNHLLAVVLHSAAEVALGKGDIAEGLHRYDRALELSGWPDIDGGPGQGLLMLAASAVDARVLYGAAGTARELVGQLIERTPAMMLQYTDLPQIGGIACAVGSFAIVTGRDPVRGLELVALAPNVYCRQDYPSMRWTTHAELAGRLLGADRFAQARAEAVELRRKGSAERILQILREFQNMR
ncbi:BTAD domain-containing putative transcriptional regulator [Nocardia sp. CS682]|uniref:AfsR/SARP family transcriptional regulator n=1 Tax=Nocardia sp. CS682 TaxID=1047172 RepID=UPI0010758579|nr:BTAD domain-containing putative transcriptional regulator [Nocardia sp. CS682]QBS45929.1 transcriptional regulator [Nocardia sp. CS682]